MAFWSKKKKEEVVHRYDLTEKPKEIKPEPVKVSFIDTIRETDFGFARIVSVRRNSNGATAHLLLDPSFIFPSGSQRMGGPNRGFSPTMNKYDDGLLLVDGIPSRISNINLEVFITEPGSRHYDNGYYRDRDEYRDRYSNRSMLTFERQVLSNAFDGLVTQTKNSILTDGKYRVELKVSSNIEVSDQSDLRYNISNIRDKVKSLIEDNFRKEIIKSKLVETKDKFFTDLSPELMTDIFQHVTDLVPDCKLIINTESTELSKFTFPTIKFFVPLIGKNSELKSQKISFEFNEKTSNILYELSECANRIKGYCDNSESKISFSSDGILIETFPEVISQHLEVKDYSDSMNDGYFRDSMYGDRTLRQQAIRVRNPYNDWNLH
jgi:hypothetical protein